MLGQLDTLARGARRIYKVSFYLNKKMVIDKFSLSKYILILVIRKSSGFFGNLSEKRRESL